MRFIAARSSASAATSATHDTEFLRHRVITAGYGVLLIGLVAWAFRVILSLAERPQSAQELGDRLRAIAFEVPWSQERASRWWDTHRAGSAIVTP